MIVPRKYECFGILYENDEKARKLIDEAFAGFDERGRGITKEKLIRYNHDRITAWFDLGCGIPGGIYRTILEGFGDLDASCPYDNGLDFRDVRRIEYMPSRKGMALEMRFVHEAVEQPYRIVGFAAIRNSGGRIETDPGWEMPGPLR